MYPGDLRSYIARTFPDGDVPSGTQHVEDQRFIVNNMEKTKSTEIELHSRIE